MASMQLAPHRWLKTGLQTGLLTAALALSGAAWPASPTSNASAAAVPTAVERARWRAQAQRVTILRDHWGVAHVYGKTDADAVFGMIHAQAEDDFKRIEVNYLNALGRLAEAEGEKAIYSDLRMRLFIDPADLQARYRTSPVWLKALMNAWADGLNHFLLTHPAVQPRVLTRFEPWMALSFTEGSIGGDIESIDLGALETFYGPRNGLPAAPRAEGDGTSAARQAAVSAPIAPEPEPRGSNGFAIAPAISANGHALLLINPHTSFYFRGEMQVVSGQGLNAYGAVTWGQFFVYQGFNDRVGWMHTSGGGDAIDEYLETVEGDDAARRTRYGAGTRPLQARSVTLRYKTEGGLLSRTFTTFRSHHGPIVREQAAEPATGGSPRWVAVSLMHEPVKALMQSYLRTKARNYAGFRRVLDLRTNSSNNTVYADADGTIAYFQGNFIPVRDPRFDFTKPVDGSNPDTAWKGLHEVKDIIQLRNPSNGWLQNTNNWPFSAAGAQSPRREDYPAYMWNAGENARGVHAVRVLQGQRDFTLDKLIASAYDTQLTAFEPLLPRLLAAYDASADSPAKAAMKAPVEALRGWNLRYALDSVPTSLAVYWYQELRERSLKDAQAAGLGSMDYITTRAGDTLLLGSLPAAVARLEADFGRWQTPWGEINRFQRLTGDIVQPFDDAQPSTPMAYASGNFGSLASFGMGRARTTKRLYGEVGNSFVAVVEFGPRIQARSILVGGQSGDPKSPHFKDQVELYSRGEFKDVWFYRADVEKNLERRYHPGE
jgi:acyl-homoserine-lactone acylase